MPAVWLELAGDEPVAVEVTAGHMLRAGLTYFATRAAGPDLMLTSRNTNDGICVAFDHLPWGDEYEIHAWGAFAL
jgi:hypothetical protein